MKYKMLSIAAALLVAGCTSPQLAHEARTTQADVFARGAMMNGQAPQSGVAIRGSGEQADALAIEQSKRPVLRKARAPYIGSRMVPVTAEDRLPSVFRQDFSFNADDVKVGRTVTLSAVANRVTNWTGIPVRIQSDVEALPVNAVISPQKAAGDATAHADGADVVVVKPLALDVANLRYSGTLSGFLTSLTDRLGLTWEYRDGAVVIMRFVTEAHEVSAFIGKTTYDRDAGTGGQTGEQSDSKLSVKENGSADAFVALESAIKKMLSQVPGSELTRADGSKRLWIKTSREMQAQVRDYIASENAIMRKQALIQFDIYSVQTTDQDERGLNLNVLFNSLSNIYGVTVGSPSTLTGLNAGQLGISILKGDSETSKRFGDSSAILAMLNQLGSNAQHRTIPMVALNGTWARKSQLNTESYISETTPGSGSVVGSGAPGIKTDKVTTGDKYLVMPQIMGDNSIMLRLGMSLSDLLGLTDQTSGVGVNQQKVQTTKVSSNTEQYDVLVKPGEIMSITGLSRLVASGDQRSLSESMPIGFGGSRKVGMVRQHFIVFVRTVVL